MSRDYSPATQITETQLAYSHQVAVRADITPNPNNPLTRTGTVAFTLPIISGTLTEDWAWSPAWQGTSITLPIPDDIDPAVFDLRWPPLVRIFAGYPDYTADAYMTLFTGYVRTYMYSLPESTITLGIASAETLTDDYRFYQDGFAPRTSNITDWLTDCLNEFLKPLTASIVSTVPDDTGSGKIAGITYSLGNTGLTTIVDMASRVGVWIHVDSTGQWRIDARPGVKTAYDDQSADLFTGPGGLVTSITHAHERGTWYNGVVLDFWYSNANGEVHTIGKAFPSSQSTPDQSMRKAGAKIWYEQRNAGATQSQADQAAAAQLQLLLNRNGDYIIGCPSIYWLRVGQSIRFMDPITNAITAAVATRTVFDLAAHTMNITVATTKQFTTTNTNS